MIASLWTRGRSCYLFISLVQSMAFHEAYFARPSLLNRSNNLALGASRVMITLQPEDRAEFSKGFARYTLFALGVIQVPPDAIATTPNTLVNSVLSAYGIPMIADKDDFTSVYVQVPDDSDQRTVCAFSYPNFWVEGKKRDGLISASNYQTGDSVTLAVGAAPGKALSIGRMSALDIAAATTPSQGVVQVLRETLVANGGVNYKYLTVKYNVITRSGYDVERIAYVAATVKQRKLFSLVATVSSERRKKIALDLDAIQSSFRVGEGGEDEGAVSENGSQ